MRFLASKTEQPNIPDDEGDTPIHEAAKEGFIESKSYLFPMFQFLYHTITKKNPFFFSFSVVRLLANYTDNPNTPNKQGLRPTDMMPSLLSFFRCLKSTKSHGLELNSYTIQPSKRARISI